MMAHIYESKSYLKALEFAKNEKFDESLSQLQKTKDEITQKLGSPFTELHIYLLQRQASIKKL